MDDHLVIRKLRFRKIHQNCFTKESGAGDKLALIDLLGFEGHDPVEQGIPGSIRMSAARLKIGPKLLVPKDVEVVLYCSSRQQILSARVALGLKRREFDQCRCWRAVWTLGAISASMSRMSSACRKRSPLDCALIRASAWPRRLFSTIAA